MKRLSLFILLLLTSLRLVASVAGLALGTEGLGTKACYTTQHSSHEPLWFLAESDPAEESEEDSDEGLHPAVLPTLTAWVLGFGIADQSADALRDFPAQRLSQPLFLLFENFRI